MAQIRKRHSLNIRNKCPALSENDVTGFSPVTGLIDTIYLDFGPTGGLVEAYVHVGASKILPDSAEGITVSDATIPFKVCTPIDAEEIIKLKIVNHDNSNSRTVSAIIQFIEDEVI